MNNSEMLNNQLLITLSYFEPMSLEYIYLDLDQDFLHAYPELTIEDLKHSLESLEKSKKIRQLSEKDSPRWIRIYPRKTFWQRLQTLLP